MTSYFLVKTISEAIPLAEVVRWRFEQKNRRQGRCPTCGYLVEQFPRCPECGAANNPSDTSRDSPRLSGIGARLEYGYALLAATTILIASLVALVLPGSSIFWPAAFAAGSAWFLYAKVRGKAAVRS